MDEIVDVWYEWKAKRFPRSLTGLDLFGIDFVMLDADAAALIGRFIAAQGALDPDEVLILQGCADDLALVGPELDGETWNYFQQLHTLARLVLRELGL